ncbi:MAG TPA: GNAT family N-acetyltransferase [Burkholderiaceae bacterium]|nr:GNAT family N-acetyltransferase [Burkholderiaceae bacterium]
MSFHIEAARPEDAGVILRLIGALAQYEKLSHLVVAKEDDVRRELFGANPVVECVLGWQDARAVGFALFFHNFSTFLGRRGLYLEDLFVIPEARGHGYGKALIQHVARLAVVRGCGRVEWAVLDWNRPAIDFYQALGADVLPDWRICRLTGDALVRFGGDAPARAGRDADKAA